MEPSEVEIAELQNQLVNVTKERNNFWKFYTDTQQQLSEKEDNYQTLLDDAIVMRQQLAASQLAVERLKQRLDDVNVKDSVKTREINLLVDDTHRLQAENTSLQQENERLKAQVQGAQTFLADEKCRCFLERAQKAETLLRELAEALKADYNTFTQAAQLIDGWNATEAEWSEWDRSVRTMITDCMVKARAALARAEEALK